MPKPTALSESQYAKLVRDIRRILEEGRQRAVWAAQQELVNTYWQIGKRISEENMTQNAGCNAAVLEGLAGELQMDISTLRRSVKFFQTYAQATSSLNINWSHYKQLIPIDDGRERRWYEGLVEREKLTSLRLKDAIQNNRYAESLASPPACFSKT